MKDFSEELRNIPHRPGVYLMMNAKKEIIYVGKAIDLNHRVRSYFQTSRSGKSAKVLAMVDHVDSFDYILVENEVEALILESNFIKEHMPKYNILLRDDKQYPLVFIPKEKFPRLLKVRKITKDEGNYFGPFPSAQALNEAIRLFQRLYMIRTCNLDFDKGQTLDRPCLNYFIGQCPAPCVGLADEALYMAQIEKVRNFFRGKDQSIQDYLQAEMLEASKALDFERAAKFRDALFYLEDLMQKQKISSATEQDADIIAMARGDLTMTVQVYFMRNGKIVDRDHYLIHEEFEEKLSDVLASFLKLYYLDKQDIPGEILVETMPSDQEAILKFLSQKRGGKVQLRVPQRGKKSDLLDGVKVNAKEFLQRQERKIFKRERNRDRGIHALETLLQLKDLYRLEAYDVSNISGVANVGSMVVFYREKMEKKEYRKFKIQSVETMDEYASQREMLERRFDHGLKDKALGKTKTGFGFLPDLILMDGGKGQVNVCLEVLKERNLEIPVLGLVKDDKHRTRAFIYQNEEYPLDIRSPLYRFLYKIQEEVHRFALHYHHKLRTKEMVHSQLDEIFGIGEKRKEALLKEFVSVERIAQASLEELSAVASMNKKSAQAVFDYFHRK